jgi:hypothetical protein
MPLAAMRPMMSVPPPGAKATIMRMGRFGYSPAAGAWASAAPALAAATQTVNASAFLQIIFAPGSGAIQKQEV